MKNNKKAQVITGEYVLVLFILLGIMTAMTIYLRRGIQARIYDARHAAIEVVQDSTQGYLTSNLYHEYEPYYTESETNMMVETEDASEIFPKGWGEDIWKNIVVETNTQSVTETKPPKDAD